jgi:hypothetical protein
MDKYNVDNYSYDYRGDWYKPVLSYGIDPTDPNGWTLAEIRIRPQYVTNKFDNAQLDFNWNISPGFRLKGGVQAKDYSFDTRELRRGSELAVPTFTGGTRIVPADLTELARLSGVSGSPGTWVIPDYQAVADLFDIYSNSGTFAVAERAVNTRSVEEEDRGVYLMGEFSTDLGPIPLSGNVGVRYVRTKQTSTGIATTGRGDRNARVQRHPAVDEPCGGTQSRPAAAPRRRQGHVATGPGFTDARCYRCRRRWRAHGVGW